jgi:hypothetical protein|nr:MAG TPA: Low affinity iron permease [Bacteriophage sp.]
MGTVKGNLIAFISRKLFFSLVIFGVCAWLLSAGRLNSDSFETITISIIAVYLTSNIATRYTVTKGKLMADLAQAQQTEHRNDEEQTEYEEYVEELNEKPKG